MNKRQIIFKEIQRLGNSITKKEGVLQEKFNNDIVAQHVKQLMVDGKQLPENSPFKSLIDWNTLVEKKDSKYKNQLEKIEYNSVIMDVLNKYITSYSETLE